MAIEFDGEGNIVGTTPDGAIAVKLYSLEKQIAELKSQLQQKDKEIERLNNIINELEKYAGLGELNWEDKYQDIMLSGKGLLKKNKRTKRK